MKQQTRVLVAVVILIALVGAVLGIDQWRRANQSGIAAGPGEPTLAPGAIPIRLDGRLVGGLGPDDIERLQKVSYVEPEEGKTQEGCLLRDIILLYLKPKDLAAGSLITVSSSSRNKSAQVTWAEASDMDNMVMFDISNRGTLKLVSKLAKLDQRDEWVQDTDSIEVTSP